MEVQPITTKNKQRRRNKKRDRNNRNNRNNPRGSQKVKNDWEQEHNDKFMKTGSKIEQTEGFSEGNKPPSCQKNGDDEMKQQEFEHLVEMFGKEIEREVIRMCWESSNSDYEQTIMALSCMTCQKEDEKQDFADYSEEMPQSFEKYSQFDNPSENFEVSYNENDVEENQDAFEEFEIGEESKEHEENELGASRTNNPFTDAFNDFKYREPDEEEMKESKRIADSYMELQEREESEWFMEQEKKLLQTLIDDCQLTEYLGEGVLDEETLKLIIETSTSSPTTSQPSTSSLEEPIQDFYTMSGKKNKKRRNKKKKNASPMISAEKFIPQIPINTEKPFDETNIAEEAVDFANDSSLQYLISQQILADQENKMYSEYQYDQQEFPSLLKGDDLKQIRRKKAFAVNEWTKTKGTQGSLGCGDDLEAEQIRKIKKVFPALHTDI